MPRIEVARLEEDAADEPPLRTRRDDMSESGAHREGIADQERKALSQPGYRPQRITRLEGAVVGTVLFRDERDPS